MTPDGAPEGDNSRDYFDRLLKSGEARAGSATFKGTLEEAHEAIAAPTREAKRAERREARRRALRRAAFGAPIVVFFFFVVWTTASCAAVVVQFLTGSERLGLAAWIADALAVLWLFSHIPTPKWW
jgi:hypothetical protein